MLNTLYFLGAAASLLALARYKNVINPITVFGLYWLAQSILSSFGLFHFYKPQEDTLLIVAAGILAFALGGFLSEVLAFRLTYGNWILFDRRIGKLRTWMVYGMYAIVILYSLLRSYGTVRMLLHGGSLDVVREVYYNEDSVSGSGPLFTKLDSFLIKPLTMALIPVSCAELFTGTKNWKLILFAATTMVLFVITSGGRDMIVHFAIDLMVCAMMSGHRRKLTRRQKRILFRLIGAASIAVLFITVSRQINSSLQAEIYRYFCGAMSQFDVRLHSFQKNPVYTYGYTSFRGFIMPVGVILRKIIGFEYPDIYVYAASIGDELQTSVTVGNQVWMKAFVTLFYFFYVDGGLPAVLLLSALYGFFSNRMFLRARAEPNGRNLAVFAFFMQGILMSMVRMQFYIPGYAWGLLCIIFMYRRSGRRFEYGSASF